MKRRVWMVFPLILIFSSAISDVVIKGEMTHEYTVLPGQDLRGAIVIRNQGAASEEVVVYQTDYLFFSDGTNLYGDPGQTPRSNAGWITFAPKRVAVPGGEEITVSYSIAVPLQTEMRGTYWSLIMVEAVPRHLTGQEVEPDKMALNVVWRYGIQIVTHVGEGSSELRFSGISLTKEEDGRFLEVDVENTGEIWLKPLVWAELYDDTGKSIGKFEGIRMRTYPGTSIRERINLSVVKPGVYKALVVADCGGDALFGANYTLKIETQ